VRAPITLPRGPHELWSLDFVSDAFTDSRRFGILAPIGTKEAEEKVADDLMDAARKATNR
jgi:putative transposase